MTIRLKSLLLKMVEMRPMVKLDKEWQHPLVFEKVGLAVFPPLINQLWTMHRAHHQASNILLLTFLLVVSLLIIFCFSKMGFSKIGT